MNELGSVAGRTEKTGPLRTCVGCGKKRDKARLIRLAVVSGGIVVDEKYRLPGRGVYCCREEKCMRMLAKIGKKLARALHCERLDQQRMLSLINTMVDSFVEK